MLKIVRADKKFYLQFDSGTGELLSDALRYLDSDASRRLALHVSMRVQYERLLGFSLFEMPISRGDCSLIHSALRQYKSRVRARLKSINAAIYAYERNNLI